jgi:hypothetical protein
MSKVFITKNGQFLSRGEGVLTRIENPDLEVNDIGVEVSERIAEDVKEGDVLFNGLAGVDEQTGVFHTFGPAAGAKFVKNEYGLYCVVGSREAGFDIDFLKYVDGKWIQLTDIKGRDSLNVGPRMVTAFGTAAIPTQSGKIVWASTPDPASNLYQQISIGYYEGNLVTELQIPHESIPKSNNYGGRNIAPFWCVDLIEHDNHVFVSYGYYRNQTDTSGPSTLFYKIDTSSNIVEHIPTLATSSTPRDIYIINLFKYNDELYCASESEVLKYDSSSNTFSAVGTAAGLSRMRSSLLTTSSNDIYRASCRTDIGIRIEKFNTSTSSFDLVFYNYDYPTTLSGMRYRPDAVAIYENESGIHVVLQDRVTSQEVSSTGNIHQGLVYNFNTASSSLELEGSLGTYYKSYGIQGVASEDYRTGFDFIKFEDEYWIVSTAYNGENIQFYKSTDGINYERYKGWDIVPIGNYQSGPATYEFSGTIHHFIGDRQVAHRLTIYDPSSDSFLPNGRTDIHKPAYASKFFELNGNLYLVHTGEQSPYVFVYSYDFSANQFHKLADSITLPATSYGIEVVEFSGLMYLTFQIENNSIYFNTATFDGSSFNLLSQPSSLPYSSRMYYAPKLFINNDKLFMTITKRVTTSEAEIGFYTYQLDGSSWNVVDPGPSDNWLVSSVLDGYLNDEGYPLSSYRGAVYSVIPFEIGSRQCALINMASLPRHAVYEYIDGSGWFIDTSEKPLVGYANYPYHMEHIHHNGYDYFYYNSNGTVHIRDPYGKWKLAAGNPQNSRSEAPEMVVLNDQVNIFEGDFNYSQRRWKVSPYVGEKVWMKLVDPTQYTTYLRPKKLAYGIALQDGSEGDIIKIRRIKS